MFDVKPATILVLILFFLSLAQIFVASQIYDEHRTFHHLLIHIFVD